LSATMCVLSFSSCYYDSDEFLYTGFDFNCDTLEVSYSNAVLPILDFYCFTCHSSKNHISRGAGNNLEDFDQLRLYAEKGILMGALRHEPGFANMPKDAPKLDECDIRVIEKWVGQGNPQN
jgi:hypothetical protein